MLKLIMLIFANYQWKVSDAASKCTPLSNNSFWIVRYSDTAQARRHKGTAAEWEGRQKGGLKGFHPSEGEIFYC